ncbi:spermatogenesis-associated protein 17 [Diretmus argenteus]
MATHHLKLNLDKTELVFLLWKETCPSSLTVACLAEENRQREIQAATQIQSWFRVYKVRVYLSHLHKKATIIQKIWRGFAARARLRQMVKAAYFIMKMNFYEEMAVRIQCRWRGFYARKYLHNYYARKRYLEGLATKNELVRRGLDELEDLQKREREHLEMQREQTAKMYQARRLHHLISTKQCPGVFNSPFNPAPHEMELLLRQAKPQPSAKLSLEDRACLLGRPGAPAPTPPGAPGSPQIHTTKTCCSVRPLLPPIASKKPQGPFREPDEVWEQRRRCPELSLRVQTPYTHLEEAREERQEQEAARLLTDTPFLPFAKAHQRNKKYVPLLHSSSSFPPLAYGNKHFREEDRHRFKEPFKTVFTTCNSLDKFGRLYSKAGNIV